MNSSSSSSRKLSLTPLALALLTHLIVGLAATEPASAQVVMTEVSKQIPVRTITRSEFCNRLSTGLQQYSLASGFNPKQSGLIASAATDDLVVAFKSGRATDYINPVALAAMAGPDASPKNSGYIPMANFIGPALGIDPAKIVLALSVGELRFIPHVQQGMDIVVIAQNAAPLTPERAKAIAETASKLKIKIHVVWVGEAATNSNKANKANETGRSGDENSSAADSESQAMAFLAAVTGGSFADLSGSDHCGRSL